MKHGQNIFVMDALVPIPLEYATPSQSRAARPLALVGIALAAILAGTLVGASTNAINGAVSPTYFVNVMGWNYVSNVWLASVFQGVFEGSAVGLLFSAILTTTIGIVTRATCECGRGLRWLGYIVTAIYAAWTIGGICGLTLAEMSPLFFQSTFIGVPSDHAQMLRYAWVGGSIWGAEFGGFAVVIVGLILFRISWRRMLKQERGVHLGAA
jgi:hypothetical protein